MAYLQTELVTHTRRVCILYKKALRWVEDWYHDPANIRYQCALMRARFEKHKDEKDLRVAKQLLLAGEEELFQLSHPQPKKFPYSPGGIAYQREVIPPDWVLDHWHPLEKAQYPTYFATREKRKLEYIEYWEKQYGKPEKDPVHH